MTVWSDLTFIEWSVVVVERQRKINNRRLLAWDEDLGSLDIEFNHAGT